MHFITLAYSWQKKIKNVSLCLTFLNMLLGCLILFFFFFKSCYYFKRYPVTTQLILK